MISDAVVIGVVLGLVFAAACYYLYTRSSSLERKVGLMENILLDLKVTTEQALMSVTEAPTGSVNHYEAKEERVDQQTASSSSDESDMRTLAVDLPRNNRTAVPTQVSVEREAPAVSSNYEAMTYKELIAIAKQKGVSGTRNASKAHVIDLLRRHDAGGGSSVKSESVMDSLDAHFATTPLDENMEKAGTDLELLPASNMEDANAAPLDAEEVDGSLVQ